MKPIPDFFLGDSESSPPHWGGEPRRCYVRGRPVLATGKRAWLVRVEPPLPSISSRLPVDQVVLAEHFAGDDLASLSSGWLLVNVCRPASETDLNRPRFGEGDLVIEYWGEVARSREALPEPIDYAVEWQRTLRRIKRFIDQHGHSQVPKGYADDEGPLDVIVGNIRWHRAGKAGVSPGPFPGVDYASDLDRLPGWEW